MCSISKPYSTGVLLPDLVVQFHESVETLYRIQELKLLGGEVSTLC